MVTLVINQKQHGSLPLSMGMQIELTKYSRDGLKLARRAKEIQEIEAQGLDLENEEQIDKLDALLDETERLNNTKISLILRAFANKFTMDELLTLTPEEIDTAIAKLQLEARGAAPKNAPAGAGR